jgi:hypothetical protein
MQKAGGLDPRLFLQKRRRAKYNVLTPSKSDYSPYKMLTSQNEEARGPDAF